MCCSEDLASSFLQILSRWIWSSAHPPLRSQWLPHLHPGRATSSHSYCWLWETQHIEMQTFIKQAFETHFSITHSSVENENRLNWNWNILQERYILISFSLCVCRFQLLAKHWSVLSTFSLLLIILKFQVSFVINHFQNTLSINNPVFWDNQSKLWSFRGKTILNLMHLISWGSCEGSQLLE